MPKVLSDVTLAGSLFPSQIDAKGDLWVGSAADTLVRVPVGANGKVLTADSSTVSGVAWADASGGGSASISRTFMMMGG